MRSTLLQVLAELRVRLKQLRHSFLQWIGLAVLSTGLFMQWPWVGVTAAGAGVLLIGIADELDGGDARTPD